MVIVKSSRLNELHKKSRNDLIGIHSQYYRINCVNNKTPRSDIIFDILEAEGQRGKRRGLF